MLAEEASSGDSFSVPIQRPVLSSRTNWRSISGWISEIAEKDAHTILPLSVETNRRPLAFSHLQVKEVRLELISIS